MDKSEYLDMLAKRYRWRRLFISFSGGETSAKMTKTLLDTIGRGRRNVVVGFCNTSREHEKTLRYVRDATEAYDFGTVWLEAQVRAYGDGTRAKVVDFETACRDGSVFEAVIAKYGLPNIKYEHCSRELKLNTMRSYLRRIGWAPGTYDTAIGIRADERDRCRTDAKENGIIYPLVDLGVTKADVHAEMSGWNVQLGLPEHYGNCLDCQKKSLRKLMTIAKEAPQVFDWSKRMDEQYANAGSGEARKRYREQRTAADILTLAQQPFEPFVDGRHAFDPVLDEPGGCGETCDVFADRSAA